MFATMDIHGYLGKDPEFKKTTNGKDYAQFSVGVTKTANGVQKTQWFQIKAWAPLDEVVKNLKIRRGSSVFVRGYYELQEYSGKAYSIVQANMIEIMGKEKSDEQKAEVPYEGKQFQVPQNNIKEIANVIVEDDDLPF